MLKIRIRFSKTGTLRFIGHLDFLRVFQQTIRRSGLPAAFSQGFNPHLLISFALPLPLGMESLNDYADITLESEMPADTIVKKLSAAAPDGLIIHGAKPAENKAASVVAVADYMVKTLGASPPIPHKGTSPPDPIRFSETIVSVLKSREIIIPKKTKKGVKDTDIRPDILNIEVTGENVFMRLSAGSARFLHPMTVAGIIFNEPCVSAITRTELYQEITDGGLLPL